MTRKEDRDLAARLKAGVALAALRGEKSVAELARQFNLDPAQVDEWKKELERNAAAAFARPEFPPHYDDAPTLPDPPRPARLSTLPTLATLREQPTLPQSPARPEFPRPPTDGRPAPREAAVSGSFQGDPWGDDEPPATGQHTTMVPAAGAAPRLPPDQRPPAWTRKFLGPLFLGWQEKHHAAKTSRELLKLYRSVSASHPRLTKHELYREIVRVRMHGTLLAADAVLTRAAESFASWPVERPLTFRDVVHYLAVSDYLALSGHVEEWTHESLGRVVALFVPDDL